MHGCSCGQGGDGWAFAQPLGFFQSGQSCWNKPVGLGPKVIGL